MVIGDRLRCLPKQCLVIFSFLASDSIVKSVCYLTVISTVTFGRMPTVRESFACFVKTEKYANVKGVKQKRKQSVG